jgi:WD40 repeat protein
MEANMTKPSSVLSAHAWERSIAMPQSPLHYLALTFLFVSPSTIVAAEDVRDARSDPLPPGAVLRLGSTRLRPGGSVQRLAFSPDGGKLASWSTQSSVTDALCLWDAKSGRLLRRIDLSGADVPVLAWRVDGRGATLISTRDDKLLVWDFTDEKADPKIPPRARVGMVGKVAVPGGPVVDNERDSCYAISPDGKTLAVGRTGGLENKLRPIRLHPIHSGARVRDLPAGKELAQHPGNCELLLFTPNGKQLVVVNAAKRLEGQRLEEKQLVIVRDTASGKESVRFTAPTPARNGPPAIAVSNRTLAIGLEDGATSSWDLASGNERRLETGHNSKKPGEGYGTFAVAVSPDGKTLATAGRDGLVKLWDVAGGRLLHTLERHYSWIEALAFSPDGRTVASAGQDGIIRLWDTASGADACPQPGHRAFVRQAALSPDGKTIVTGGWDHTLRWWDAATGRELRVVALPSSPAGLVISPDGKTVLAALYQDGLHTWDLASGRETTPNELPRDKKTVGPIIFTPNGRHLLLGSGARLSLWNWPALKQVGTIELPKPAKAPGENDCQSLAVSPDGRWLVTAAYRTWSREEKGLKFGYAADGVVDVWDLGTGKRVHRLADGQGTYRSATFTADGRIVLIGAGGTIPEEGGRAAQKFEGEMNLLDPLAARWVRSFTPPPPTPGVEHRYTGGTVLAPDGRTLYVSYNTGAIVGFEVSDRASAAHTVRASRLSRGTGVQPGWAAADLLWPGWNSPYLGRDFGRCCRAAPGAAQHGCRREIVDDGPHTRGQRGFHRSRRPCRCAGPSDCLAATTHQAGPPGTDRRRAGSPFRQVG